MNALRTSRSLVALGGPTADSSGASLRIWACLCDLLHLDRGGPSSAVAASGFLEALSAAGARTWLPGEGFADRLLALAGRLGVQGPRVFDLQIALTAFDNGAADLWTHDSRFVALPGLRIHDPLMKLP